MDMGGRKLTQRRSVVVNTADPNSGILAAVRETERSSDAEARFGAAGARSNQRASVPHRLTRMRQKADECRHRIKGASLTV